MPIKSNHDIYLFNHRNFTNYIYDNRYGIYVPDRLLLYFTLYKNKLEDWKIIAILAVEKETGSFQLTPTRKSFFIITKSYGTRLGVESYISAKIRLTPMPLGMTWKNLSGVALLGGIGFTVSLFIANLSFGVDYPVLLNQAKFGVLTGTVLSGLLGYVVLRISL